MGVFDESKCDCCVCPMQCVLKELVGLNAGDVGIITPTFVNDNLIINNAKYFTAFTTFGSIPISQVTLAATFDPTIPVEINKPIKKSKGECACCEDPITNLAKSQIGEIVEIEFVGPELFSSTRVEIIDVQEGIVIGRNFGNPNETDFLSSCAITRITPFNQQQINNQPRFSSFLQLKESPPAT
ncbi:hypothetical protein [Chengkuizengella axinellae]|uniref:Uncharacterized protein n=1 Tax=Chengkuizengella axinellae TaxID=3064388 RepID=A0ABT9J477_9BACL|nr:hypothetical protein [Chengkuizengella sp. 2205SS18-9]MDP5276363.1 hypothetical protein [Chengkuizengella sp. 2205SS18-9]